MRRLTASCLLVVLLALPAAAGPVEKFGAGLSGARTVALADVVKSPEAYTGRTIKTEGRVSAVCAHKGCWMVLKEGESTVRVTFKDYGFFVAKDGAGATATVEGVFSVQTLPKGTAMHYAAETPGGKPDEIKGDVKELSIVATGVELRRAQEPPKSTR
jgi:uncharacterized protein DUF4920